MYEYVRLVRWELLCLFDATGDGRSAKAIAHSPEFQLSLTHSTAVSINEYSISKNNVYHTTSNTSTAEYCSTTRCWDVGPRTEFTCVDLALTAWSIATMRMDPPGPEFVKPSEDRSGPISEGTRLKMSQIETGIFSGHMLAATS